MGGLGEGEGRTNLYRVTVIMLRDDIPAHDRRPTQIQLEPCAHAYVWQGKCMEKEVKACR
jgi:hypothetical protein